MRGKRPPSRQRRSCWRIIPAHAGQTLLSGSHRWSPPGSSPRMRGKQGGWQQPNLCARIIPAHAGQTLAALGLRSMPSDHPRACGANAGSNCAATNSNGSSPRMRGKLDGRGDFGCARRIIPAHAGQTHQDAENHVLPADHPRACGANDVNKRFMGNGPGSSPRMRGKHREEAGYRDKDRIIPAHAGQTRVRWSKYDQRPDHPRACGANKSAFGAQLSALGSSPRMRGKRLRGARAVWRSRIIPAHAGQTSGKATSATSAPDHPRACGANYCSHSRGRWKNGSSPRMRGKLGRFRLV